MLNHIVLMGRLTRDPELRRTQSGVPVVSFSLAVDHDYGDEVDFVSVIAWQKTAEFIQKHFHKGSPIIIKGRLQSRKWEDRDGKKHTSWEVVAENAYFSGDKKSDSPVFVESESNEELPF